jgi:hypothetical protein
MNKYNKFKTTLPKIFKVGTNPIITALVKALAESDESIIHALDAAKAQLFVRTASGKYLDVLAADFGIRRPPILGISDSDFRNLVPNLSIKPKQIRKAFYDTMRAFWGDLFQKANLYAGNLEPFNVVTGDDLKISIDNGDIQTLRILSGDLQLDGAATSEELARLINEQLSGITAEIIFDPASGTDRLNIRTDTPGPTGTLHIVEGSMAHAFKLDLDTTKVYKITDLAQRTVIYELENREILIEIPAILPILRRTLRGSHHFHEDATLKGPIPPLNGVWQGSFLFDETAPYTVGGVRCRLENPLIAGQVYSTLVTEAIENASEFPNEMGYIVFNHGLDSEFPIRYLGRPNDRTLVIDPTYRFKKTHAAGSYVNIIRSLNAYVPRTTGEDYAVYLTSPSSARLEVQQLLETLAAAGVRVTFVVLLPEYKYLTDDDNPYD